MYLFARQWSIVATAAGCSSTVAGAAGATAGVRCSLPTSQCLPNSCGRLAPRRFVSTSRPRHFLSSFLSSRITDRERIVESERLRKQAQRIDDLTRQVSAVDLPAAAPATPEEVFSPERRAESQRREQEFYDSIFLYKERYGRTRRGHVEFIEAALARMQELGVHRDIEAYRALMDVFPKDVMRSRTVWHSEFKYYPRQQDTALSLLDKMNSHSVMPDTEMGLQISLIFGTESYVMGKYQRMMYWMPKLRHADPWPVATLTSSGLRYNPKPSSARELALCVLRRMCPDSLTRLSTYDMEGPGEPFVSSAQAPLQQELLSALSQGATVYLDGPSRVWYGEHCVKYYVLSADPTPLAREHAAQGKAEATASAGKPQQLRNSFEEEDFSWWRRLRCPDEDPAEEAEATAAGAASALARSPSEHELADATILALAVASSRGAPDLLLRWVRLLASEPGNEALHRVNVVFRIQPDEADATNSASAASGVESQQQQHCLSSSLEE